MDGLLSYVTAADVIVMVKDNIHAMLLTFIPPINTLGYLRKSFNCNNDWLFDHCIFCDS